MTEHHVKEDKSHKKSKPAERQWTGVDFMRPTQCSVGFLEVGFKTAELGERAKTPGALEKYLANHPIPAVLGPDGRMYLTDHHHMGLALTQLSKAWDESDKPASANPFRQCCFEIVLDHSTHPSMSMSGFLAALESASLLHPFDGQGRRAARIPTRLADLQDDPYRSLAGLARKAGAFDKVDAPYTEFKWADHFRDKIPSSLIAPAHLPTAILRAIETARSKPASGLPGFLGAPKKNSDLPTLEDIARRLEKRYGSDDQAPGLPSLAAD
jgi:hypothetical protein